MPKLVVVGSGVFGTWTALLAQRSGYATTLLDARGPANDRSSSGGESRIIRLAYGADELYTMFAARSLNQWKSFFEAEHCRECFQNTGALWIANQAEPHLAQVRGVFDKLGVAFEYLEGKQLERRYPQFSFPADASAIFEPGSGALLAGKAVRAVFAAAQREGVIYLPERALPPNDTHSLLNTIETAAGARIQADQFVFAAGSWLPQLFPDVLGDRIFPTRQAVFFFEAPRGNSLFQPAAMPVWIDQSGAKIAYGFPDLEGAGVKVAFHELGPPFDPESDSRAITKQQIEEAASYLAERFPAMRGAPFRNASVCPYENTSSGDFLIDRHPQWSNVWLVGGGSGHGFKHGPAIAEYLLNAIGEKIEAKPRFLLSTKKSLLNREVV